MKNKRKKITLYFDLRNAEPIGDEGLIQLRDAIADFVGKQVVVEFRESSAGEILEYLKLKM